MSTSTVTATELAEWSREWPSSKPFTFDNVTEGLDPENQPTRKQFNAFMESLGHGRCKVCASDADYIDDAGVCAPCMDDEAVSR